MRVLFGPGQVEVLRQDPLAAEVVAAQHEAAETHDYWLILYDWVGTRIMDTVVRAKVLEFADDGTLHGHGTGSPDNQVFAIVDVLPEDAGTLVKAFTAAEPTQVAWKRLPDGTFYLPLEWANHTNGLPNVGPYLVERWERGEEPDTMRRWRTSIARPGIEAWIWWSIGGAISAVIAALWRLFGGIP